MYYTIKTCYFKLLRFKKLGFNVNNTISSVLLIMDWKSINKKTKKFMTFDGTWLNKKIKKCLIVY